MTKEENNDKRSHRVKSDYGLSDYYKDFSENNKEGVVDKNMYNSIIKEFNSHVRDRVSNKGADYVFPKKIGFLEIKKIKPSVTIDKEGNVINKLPINWKATRELWRDNESAREKKTKIRFINEHTKGYTFRLYYKKKRANYKNKSVYRMQFNRELKRQLSKSIFAGRIDAFLR